MLMKLRLTALSVLVLLLGCNSKSGDTQSQTQNAPSQTTSASPNAANPNAVASPTITASNSAGVRLLDACTLIEKSEISAIQGAEVQSTVPTSQMNGMLQVSQCYFTVTSADGSKNLSVHLQVMKPDPKDPDAVKEYWERAFHEKGERKEREEEGEGGKPESVRGIGEEAFWIANSKVGAIYALQKGNLVRLSIGGIADIKTRLEKSKKLVATVLNRLS